MDVLKQILSSLRLAVIVLCLMGAVAGQIFAAPYGEGEYGAGIYNEGEEPAISPSPTSQPSSGDSDSSKSSGSGSSSSSTSCTAVKPSSVPDLFQINGNTATGVKLYFAPVPSNRDRYFVSYSTNSNAEEFGFEFSNDATGVIAVDVQALQPNTVYYFKVRAGNGCQPGEWSNVLEARTGQRVPSYRWSSLPRIVTTAVHQQVNPSSIQQVTAEPATTPAAEESTAPTAEPSKPTTQPATKPQQSKGEQSAPQGSHNLIQRVVNFFKGLWGN